MPVSSPGPHIIVANQPRAYREALAGVLADRVGSDRVEAADPEQLEQQLRGEVAALVVCSEVSPPVARLAGGWVLLDADGAISVSSPPEVEAMSHSTGLQAVLEAVTGLERALAQLR